MLIVNIFLITITQLSLWDSWFDCKNTVFMFIRWIKNIILTVNQYLWLRLTRIFEIVKLGLTSIKSDKNLLYTSFILLVIFGNILHTTYTGEGKSGIQSTKAMSAIVHFSLQLCKKWQKTTVDVCFFLNLFPLNIYAVQRVQSVVIWKVFIKM